MTTGEDRSISRREFVRGCALCGLGAALAPGLAGVAQAGPFGRLRRSDDTDLHEAMFWEPIDGGRTRCLTCPNRCVSAEGEVTTCKTRINRDGRLYTMTYGKPCVVNLDPLEKNPLYHVAPGSTALGVATAGCNLRCAYCQNWDISQVGPWETRNMDMMPEETVQKARDRNLEWITFSYTEPVAYYEYAIETARLAHAAGMKVAVVTAGLICDEPLQKLMQVSDAFSVTLKGYTDEFYREVCGASLADVWSTIRTLVKSGRWVEVVNLIVPGRNDEETGIRSIARSIAGLNRSIPLHFLRFAPAYKLRHLPPTPVKTLETARAIALKEGLKYVYVGLSGHEGNNTTCPKCKTLLLERAGFNVIANHLKNGRCPSCRTALAGVALG